MNNIAVYNDFTGEAELILGLGGQSKLTSYITTHQEKALEKLLGRNLYADFDSNTSAAKYIALMDGEAGYYTYNGKKYKYSGMKKLIVSYVYYKWVTSETTTQTPQGETKDLNTNGETIFNTDKIIRAYNNYVDECLDVVNYVNYKNSINGTSYYPEFQPCIPTFKNSFGI